MLGQYAGINSEDKVVLRSYSKSFCMFCIENPQNIRKFCILVRYGKKLYKIYSLRNLNACKMLLITIVK